MHSSRTMPRVKRLVLTLYRFLHRHRLPLLLAVFLPPLLLYPLLVSARGSPALVPHELRTAQRPLLVVAHPDDECLFFSPTMNALGGVKGILVLSTGNNYGIGDTRRRELMGSCRELGVDEQHCTVLDLPDIQDNPREWWPADRVLEIVTEHVKKTNADVIVTFDSGGTSGHLNHRSVHRALLKSPIPTYSTTTIPLLRKYSSILDVTLTSLSFLPNLLFNKPVTHRAFFVNGWNDYLAARRAFGSHASQLSWDRHIYMILGRYMFLNDLVKIA
ncbi:uncharacterized protein SPPG_05272 [Spizellomyces punctatus DAOM BR117]|uniref:N-acetylglucosaminylphosphatidylinositol deacetylase n=1 Tax=Spizellomyces punctatus (strain DAOM BR117) TaxID=645134 RepID=A0A0L0HEL1_SPIPD|nr:uncharacterized protein SPPG_05272 [Spizellomyces punctatus DAOM BR117]KNC99900.1 hypothetical protein SPPG_05272 [Spizellomyces punctatus DAOM BR117]|eukprot:XP_016607940.1 hypothetical protein SPPG_05272 [Spizellomyces punctatus DAOM BR117]